MKAESFKIAEGVYWVGALHWNTRSFHGFAIPGTTYNCYLVFGDEKVALIDNVYSDGMINQLNARIKDAFKKEGREEKIDVLSNATPNLIIQLVLEKQLPDILMRKFMHLQRALNFWKSSIITILMLKLQQSKLETPLIWAAKH